MDSASALQPPLSKDEDRIGFLGGFASRAMENAFRQQRIRDDLWLSYFLVAAGMLRVSLFVAADYHQFGESLSFWLLFASRLVFIFASAGVLLILRRATSANAVDRVFFGWGFVLVALTVYALSARPPGDNGLLLMSFSVILVAYCVTPLPLARQAGMALTYSAATLYVCRHCDSTILATVGATHGLSHLFGAVTSWRLNHRRREMFLGRLREGALRASLEAAVAEIQTLRGMLCICAWCKKVRDEAEIWEPVEEYVQSRSQASFSHGICPDCLQSQAGDITRSLR